MICEFMGGGFGSKAGVGSYLLLAAELATRTGRPVRCALTRRAENMISGNRNATIQRVTAGARADGTLTVLGGEYTCALGWDGWLPPTAGPTQLLYACDNVRTVEHGAKLNLPPMAAFRAPGFVEGTWSLECMLDKLAAQLGVDPLELRKLNYAHADAMDGRPYSSKGLMECYRRAEPHWARRHEVRARSDEIWKRGMGMASQIWYGGGGPPSYAWVRLGSDGRANVVTAMQDIGTGTRTAMAMIAAEELGLPSTRSRFRSATRRAGRSRRSLAAPRPCRRWARPCAPRPLTRRARCIELAAQRFDREEKLLSLKGGNIVSSDGGSWPLDRDHRPARRRPDPRQGRPRPQPHRYARAHVRDPARGGRGRRRHRRGHRREGRRDPRRRPRDQSARRAEPDRGRDHPGARPHVLGGAAGRPADRTILTRTFDSYKVPTIADVPEIVCDLVDEPDAHLTNLGSKGLGEPPIVPTAAAIANAIRDATGADVTSLPITREEILRALRDAEASEKEPVAAGTA